MNLQDPDLTQISYQAPHPDDTLVFVGRSEPPTLDDAKQLMCIGMFSRVVVPNSNPPLSPIEMGRAVMADVPDLIMSILQRLERMHVPAGAPFGIGVVWRDKAHKILRASWLSDVTVVNSWVEIKAGESFSTNHVTMTSKRVRPWEVPAERP